MKKAFALLLTIMLLVCSALPGVADPIVINENFSMRNGITYLCPMSTVKRVERANGSVPSGVGDGSLNYYTTLAGCDVCLEYWEKTPSVLQEFQYSFYSIADYKTISGSLRNKYGQPHYTEPLFGISTKARNTQKDTDGKLMDYAAWMIKYNDCYLLIEMNIGYASYMRMYIAAVNYCPLSYEVAEALLERESQEEESIENSLRNDL